MLTRCLFCRHRFRGNVVFESFPDARAVAYDPEKGRLWAICEACGRWTLAPFETRWEALEELERSVERFRVLARTDNITLFGGPGVRAVRIGPARLREEAWWRYGRRLVRRRVASVAFSVGVGTAALAGATVALGASAGSVLALGGPYLIVLAPLVPPAMRVARFGWVGWRRPLRCLRCGLEHPALSYHGMGRLRVVRGAHAGELGVRLPCPECGKNGLQLNAAEAEYFVQRWLAYRNMFGGSARRVDGAVARIEEVATSRGYVARVARSRTQLRKLEPADTLAFEMALSDDRERALLRLDVRELEARWKEAEEIAAIADGELTPMRGDGAP